MAMRDHPWCRVLQPGQACVVHAWDSATGAVREVFRTADILLEAPNWTVPDTLVLNGDGVLWRLDLSTGALAEIAAPGLPFLNNDHVPGAGDAMFVSGYDWHIHRLDLATGRHAQVTRDDPAAPLRHFLHGVSPDGGELAFIGIAPAGADDPWGPANVYVMPSAGGAPRQLTHGARPADGSEYSPDGAWIYLNTEAFSATPGHAQIARLPAAGGAVDQLTFDERVNWFPHLAPVGDLACYLAYPAGTLGHPADRDVELRVVRGGNWRAPETVARCHGGQGTINVNSWSPDGRQFAFVSYPLAG